MNLTPKLRLVDPSEPLGPPPARVKRLEGLPTLRKVPTPKPKKVKPVAIVKAERDDLTCFTCDAPAPYRIVSLGTLGASSCNEHKMKHWAFARRALGLKNRPPRRRPKAVPGEGVGLVRPPHLCKPTECRCIPTAKKTQAPRRDRG